MWLEVEGRRAFGCDYGRTFTNDAPTVVFAHGAGMDHSVWALQARWFARHGWNALALNLPAHGESAGVRSDGPSLTSVAEMGTWLDKAIRRLTRRRVALVGHSMGAAAALACAARFPARISRLALLGAAPALPVHPALLEAAEKGEPLACQLVSSWGCGPTGHLGVSAAPGTRVLEGALRLLERGPSGVLGVDLGACAQWTDGETTAASVTCPTLVVAGALDRMTPARDGRRLADLLESSELRVIDDCGHMIMLEKPDAALDALIGFLGQGLSATASASKKST